MNREIRFRGKDIKTGQWRYGDLIHGVGYKAGKVFILPRVETYPAGCNDKDGWDVIPATVGQFTGLKDKNGNEIFEGDILDTGDEEEGYDILPVAFHEAMFKFEYSSQSIPTHERINNCKVAILGNIHDDKSLLEPKQ